VEESAMSDPAPALVLLNPRAAGGRALALHGPLTRWLATHAPGVPCLATEGIEAARDTIRQQPRGSRLVLVGGDGTVHQMLPALVEQVCELALVPLGSGNDGARALGVARLDWENALAHALRAPAAPMDLGLCRAEGRSTWFASSLTAGFDSAVGERAIRGPARLRGLPRYLWATLGGQDPGTPRWPRCRPSTTAASTTCATALQRFVAGEHDGQHVRACYPFVRVRTDTVARADSRLAYGFVAGPGTYETTLTRPDLFGRYYLRAVPPAAEEPRRGARGRHQRAADPGALLASPSTTTSKAALTPERRLLMRDLFDLPDLAAMDDGIANGTTSPRPASRSRWRCSPRRAWTTRCTACATTPARRPSTSRTSCCSRTTSSTSTSSSSSATR
jgi:hypothetical protein